MKQLSRSIPIGIRFGLKVERQSTGCWIWHGGRTKKGYGQIWMNGRQELAHRVSWILHHGPIPLGKLVLHECDIYPCVNPGHLFLGTNSDNIKDAIAKGRFAPPRLFGADNPRWSGR